MKVLFIIHSRNNKKHTSIVDTYKQGMGAGNEYQVLDMACGKALHIIYQELQAARPDLVMTLDCAGFEMKTEMDSISLNKLTCRVAHLLFDAPYKYKNYLQEEFNLSHFFYFAVTSDLAKVQSMYPNLPNYGLLPTLDEHAIAEWFQQTLTEMELL